MNVSNRFHANGELASLLEEAGYETRRYSGRGMYGSECLAITVPRADVAAVGAKLVQATVEDVTPGGARLSEAIESAIRDVIEAMLAVRTDDMGRDEAVVYWPSVAWDGAERSEDDDADKDGEA